ncbi:hypothetical protein K431DRAFT_28730 [Polychaeton citri CBS 116435]|uniref:Uncharacterized protein n=1 Tax=Polychaeton citri CBS 116435 TaxID=1314669 RepID=A0A9P4USQ8_9PEZI|nr:hypothetical protein K431DRAFT_28730 [Polychaeton citri CBS 116435]
MVYCRRQWPSTLSAGTLLGSYSVFLASSLPGMKRLNPPSIAVASIEGFTLFQYMPVPCIHCSIKFFAVYLIPNRPYLFSRQIADFRPIHRSSSYIQFFRVLYCRLTRM